MLTFTEHSFIQQKLLNRENLEKVKTFSTTFAVFPCIMTGNQNKSVPIKKPCPLVFPQLGHLKYLPWLLYKPISLNKVGQAELSCDRIIRNTAYVMTGYDKGLWVEKRQGHFLRSGFGACLSILRDQDEMGAGDNKIFIFQTNSFINPSKNSSKTCYD